MKYSKAMTEELSETMQMYRTGPVVAREGNRKPRRKLLFVTLH